MASKSRRRILVRGRVQGVGYRAWAQRVALDLELTGWVRNLSDGRVEILADGTFENIRRFVAAAQDGPPAAAVESVDWMEAAPSSTTGFQIRPDASAPERDLT